MQADNSILSCDIDMSGRPVVLSITPAPGSIIGTTDSIVVQFNEAMDISTVLPYLKAQGTRTFAVADTQSMTTSWSNGNKTLTITPLNTLSRNQYYSIEVDPDGLALDASGYRLETAAPTNSGGLDEAVYNQTSLQYYYRVSSGGIPAPPTGLTIGTSQGPFSSTGVEYDQLFGGTADIDFNWQPSPSGNVTRYNVYIARSANGPWTLLGGVWTNRLTGQDVYNNIRNALFGTGTIIDPVATRNFPFINERIYARVTACNGDGESASAEASAIELNPPGAYAPIDNGRAGGSGFTGQRLANGYYLADLTAGTDTKVAYVAFYEPVDPSTITIGNFSILSAVVKNVVGAEILTSSSSDVNPGGIWGNFPIYSVVKITSDADFQAMDVITIGTGVKDLAGNGIPAGTNIVIK